MDPLSRQGTKEMHTTISKAETIGRNQAKDGNLSVRGEFSLIKCIGWEPEWMSPDGEGSKGGRGLIIKGEAPTEFEGLFDRTIQSWKEYSF